MLLNLFIFIALGLCLKDSELQFKAMEFGSLKYMGQVRLSPVYGSGDQGADGYYHNTPEAGSGPNQHVIDYEYVKCGYGKLLWPDGCTFEGYWING